MKFIIQGIAVAGKVIKPQLDIAGKYLRSFDPEAQDGQGSADWTDDPSFAMKFTTIKDALDFYHQQSKTRPTRPDGRPNRPLTVATVTIESYYGPN